MGGLPTLTDTGSPGTVGYAETILRAAVRYTFSSALRPIIFLKDSVHHPAL